MPIDNKIWKTHLGWFGLFGHIKRRHIYATVTENDILDVVVRKFGEAIRKDLKALNLTNKIALSNRVETHDPYI